MESSQDIATIAGVGEVPSKQLSKRNTSNRSLIVITKVISACNLACRYCDADIYSNRRVSLDTVSQIIKKALDYADRVEFIWHGGEPLLMGIQFYEKVVSCRKGIGARVK